MGVEKNHHLNESWRLCICFMAVLRVIFWHELGVHPGPLPHTELSKLTQHGEMFRKWMVWDRVADATIQSGHRTNGDGFDDLSFSFVASFCKPHRFQVDALYKLHNSQLEKQRGLVIKKTKVSSFISPYDSQAWHKSAIIPHRHRRDPPFGMSNATWHRPMADPKRCLVKRINDCTLTRRFVKFLRKFTLAIECHCERTYIYLYIYNYTYTYSLYICVFITILNLTLVYQGYDTLIDDSH